MEELKRAAISTGVCRRLMALPAEQQREVLMQNAGLRDDFCEHGWAFEKVITIDFLRNMLELKVFSTYAILSNLSFVDLSINEENNEKINLLLQYHLPQPPIGFHLSTLLYKTNLEKRFDVCLRFLELIFYSLAFVVFDDWRSGTFTVENKFSETQIDEMEVLISNAPSEKDKKVLRTNFLDYLELYQETLDLYEYSQSDEVFGKMFEIAYLESFSQLQELHKSLYGLILPTHEYPVNGFFEPYIYEPKNF